MALSDIMRITNKDNQKKIGISEERIEAVIPVARQYLSFWREYPDMFVDFLQTGYKDDIEPTFNLYFYQRVFLRAAMRHKYMYAVFPRGFSKSLMSILILMLRCVFYPGAHLFVTTGSKERIACSTKQKCLVANFLNCRNPLQIF